MTNQSGTSKTILHPVYSAEPYGTYRCALLPANDWLHRKDIAESLSSDAGNPLVKLAVFCASLSLFEELTQSERDSLRKAAIQKLKQYIGRMCTRATPFGAFAAVGRFDFGETNDLRATIAQSHLCVEADSDWANRFLESGGQAPSHLGSTRQISMSSNVRRIGDRIYLLPRQIGETENQQRSSIGVSPPVLTALKLSVPSIDIDDLLSSLVIQYGVSRERAESLVGSLADQGILVTDYWSDFFCIDQMYQRLTSSSKNSEIVANLSSSRLAMNGPRDAETCLAELERLQSSLASTGVRAGMHELQIDTFLNERGTLSSLVAHDMEKAVLLLLRLSGNSMYSAAMEDVVESYTSRFTAGTKVPFREFCTEDIFRKLDATGANLGVRGNVNAGMHSRLLSWSLLNKRAPVKLGEHEIDELDFWDRSKERPPVGVDIVCNLLANGQPDSSDEVAYKLMVGSNIGATGSAKMHGRFLRGLGDDFAEEVLATVRKEEEIRGADFAELLFPLKNARLANVVARTAMCRYEVLFDVAATSQREPIHPNQITIAFQNDSFQFFFHNKFGDEIEFVPRLSHMLNSQYLPDNARLMIQMATHGVRKLASFSWGHFEGSVFLPRVECGRIILRAAEWRWRPDLDIDGNHRKVNVFQFKASFAEWRKKNGVPDLAYLAQADNRLLLDFNSEDDIEKIFKDSRRTAKSQSIVFHEPIPGPCDAVAVSELGSHITEVSCSFLLNKPKSVISQRSDLSRPKVVSSSEDKTIMKPFHPGSEWLYAKLYFPEIVTQDALLDHIAPFATQSVERGLAEKWFFIRYADPKTHLRLRFKASNRDGATHELIRSLAEFALDLSNRGLLTHYSFDTYEPEITRYGGLESLDFAHDCFHRDSVYVCELFKRQGDFANIPSAAIVLVSLDAISAIFFPEIALRAKWVRESLPNPRESGVLFRQQKDLLRDLISNSKDVDSAVEMVRVLGADYSLCLRTLSEKHQDLFKVWDEFAKTRILGSLLHMHCNRFFGINRNQETLCYGVLRHALGSIANFPYEE